MLEQRAAGPDAHARSMGDRPDATRALLTDALVIALAHAIACAIARAAGFDHVSDDDFARVTIAQSFAHAPKLDPSGTSWLPFPFWITGGAMAVVGRSLEAARAVSIALSSVAAATPYLALRWAGVPRGRAYLALAFAFGTPWALWLGAATVPESLTASLVAASALGLGAVRARAPALGESGPPSARAAALPLLFALAIAAACLSRYEAWPVAATLAVTLAVRARRAPRRERAALLGAAAIAAAAPLLWMAWNAHAHDGPLHFFRRVSGYKRAIGAGAGGALEALALYPLLFATTRPEVAIPALFLAPTLAHRETRARWGVPLACAAAIVAFVSYGNARDGAPAHHPERALLGATLVVALFVVDVGMTKLRDLAVGGRASAAKAAAACFAIAWVVSGARGWAPPGQGSTEDRRREIARGAELRREDAARVVVTPCAFEHFALIAAFGAPERVTVLPHGVGPLPDTCPGIEVR